MPASAVKTGRSGVPSTAPNGNKYQGRDRQAPRHDHLGPRDAGVQKIRGRPFRPEPSYDRAARHGPGRDEAPAAPRGYPRNAGQAAGSRHGYYPPQGGRPGRAPAETQRPAPSWGRSAPPAREGPAPARLPPPAGRRAPAPERSAPAARAPRSDFGGSQRAPNPRAPARAPAPDRGAAASAAGFPVGRQRPFAPPGAVRASTGAPHSGPPRGRADRPAPTPRVGNAAFVPQPERYDAPVPASRGVNRSEAGRYDEPPARYNNAVAPNQRAPRHDAPPHRAAGNRPAPAAPRGGNARAAPAQPFSPTNVHRQAHVQHSANLRSPVAPVQLPPPRLGPIPGAGPPGLAGDDYTPRGSRRESSSQVDRPR